MPVLKPTENCCARRLTTTMFTLGCATAVPSRLLLTAPTERIARFISHSSELLTSRERLACVALLAPSVGGVSLTKR